MGNCDHIKNMFFNGFIDILNNQIIIAYSSACFCFVCERESVCMEYVQVCVIRERPADNV